MPRRHYAVVFAMTVALLTPTADVGAQTASPTADAQVAFVFDGPDLQVETLRALFQAEIEAVAGRRFALTYRTVLADYTLAGVEAQVAALMDDPDVDAVVAMGPLASQVAASLTDPPHPVIATVVLDPAFQGLPEQDGTSGAPGIAYLTVPFTFARDVDTFRAITPVSHLAVLVNGALLDGLPALASRLQTASEAVGVRLTAVGLDTSIEASLDALPDDVDGVYVTPLNRFAPEERAQLAAALIERGLPSFAYGGAEEVALGFMASLNVDFIEILARRVGVYVERILLGDDPATFPVRVIAGERLVLNLATARALDVYPPLGFLLEAELIGDDLAPAGENISLEDAVVRAVEANRSLAIQDAAVDVSAAQIREARSLALPQLSVNATGLLVDSRLAEVSQGQRPEWDVAGTLELSQVLFSEDVNANIGIQRALLDVSDQSRSAERLDIALDAAEAYLNVLRAEALVQVQQNNLRLTRQSLEFADQREAIGTAGPAEGLRLRSELATRRTDLIDAFVQGQAARLALNQVLDRPLEAPFTATEVVQADDPALLESASRLSALIVDPSSFARVRDAMVEAAIETEPNVQVLDASIRAQERAAQAARRAFFLPTVAAFGQVDLSIYEGGAGSDLGPMAPTVPNPFWTVGLNFSFPLFEGGGRFATRDRVSFEVLQLQLQRDLLVQQIEQNVRTQMQFAAASFASVQEARRAADVAQQSLAIVTDSYAAGAVDVTPLLEAQNTLQQAEVGVTNAIYDYLIDVKRVERAVGRVEALMAPAERDAFEARILEALTTDPDE
ncbi:MAG: TolC family protein [Bacteroidota bacterium]